MYKAFNQMASCEVIGIKFKDIAEAVAYVKEQNMASGYPDLVVIDADGNVVEF